MFGTAGIRGIYGKEVDEALAFRLGNAFCKGEVAVAHDLRDSSTSLAFSLMSGIICAGGHVKFFSSVPTGTLAYYSKNRGVMVTASHNPPEYNGFKFFLNKMELLKGDQKELLKKMNDTSRAPSKEWEICGSYEYEEAVLRSISLERELTVVVDNYGVGATLTAKLLNELGCRVLSFSFQRTSEPTLSVLSRAAHFVKRWNADLGIVHDGDGDRAVVVGKEIINADAQLIALMRCFNSAVLTKECSQAVLEEAQKNNVKVKLVDVGSTNVGEAIFKEGFEFGGEPCGEYIFPSLSYSPDGVFSALKFAELVSKGEAFSYPSYVMRRKKFPSANKDEAMKKIEEHLGIKEGERVNEDWGWYMVRRSGTEPLIRLTLEAYTRENAEKEERRLSEVITRFA